MMCTNSSDYSRTLGWHAPALNVAMLACEALPGHGAGQSNELMRRPIIARHVPKAFKPKVAQTELKKNKEEMYCKVQVVYEPPKLPIM